MRKWEELKTYFSDDFVDHNPRWNVYTTDELVTRVREMIEKLETTEDVKEMVAVEDKVFIRVNVSGTHKKEAFGFPPTGKKIEWEAIEIWRFDNEAKIAEIWFSSDILGLLYQLGLELPEKHKNL
jgi:predicted ester cyclase